MKKVTLLIALAALVVFAGCKKEKETNGVVLKASIEQNKGEGKTSLNPANGAINWTAGDKILVNNGTSNATSNAIFTLTGGAGSKNGTFTYNGDYTFGASNVAVYPETATINGNTVSLTLPEAQTFTAAGTFGNGANPMLGTFADPEALTFTSLCGVLGVSLTGNNVAITGIEIVSNLTDDKLNGLFEADCTATNPALTPATGNSGTNHVMLNCAATLTDQAQEFYFVLPVGTLANGFTMNVYYGGSEPFSKSTTSTELAVEWNTVKVMSTVEVVASIDPLATPLTLEAETDGTIVVNIMEFGGKGGGVYPGSSKGGPSNVSVKYSVNGGEKHLITTTTTIEDLVAGDRVQFYGNGPDVINHYIPNIAGGTAQVKVYGNIMSMLDEHNYATLTTLQTGAFYALFGGNANLTDASGLLLPATTLAEVCCFGMFFGCTSLTAAPELPATDLAAQCYYYMFQGCTSLTTAPTLPAETLAVDCYYGMFNGCTSLTTAPALPATELAEGCYAEMFNGCTSLTTAPALPATALPATQEEASGCYSYMFNGCTSLTTAPELPAPALAAHCYDGMFQGCTSLVTAPALPAETLASDCYRSMFKNCTSLTTAPALPATTLANYCYRSMFSGCTSLTTAPVLPATTLKVSCYNFMFSGCTSLNSVTCLATDISASNCINSWLQNVAATGTFYANPSTNWTTNSPSGIPSGWTRMDAQ